MRREQKIINRKLKKRRKIIQNNDKMHDKNETHKYKKGHIKTKKQGKVNGP